MDQSKEIEQDPEEDENNYYSGTVIDENELEPGQYGEDSHTSLNADNVFDRSPQFSGDITRSQSNYNPFKQLLLNN
jgi:hypothetical protein